MNADKYLLSIKRIHLMLLALIVPILAILISQVFTVSNTTKGVTAIIVTSIYDALQNRDLDIPATNRDISSVLFGNTLTSFAELRDSEVRRTESKEGYEKWKAEVRTQTDFRVPEEGFDQQITQVLKLGEISSQAFTLGACETIAIRPGSSAPEEITQLWGIKPTYLTAIGKEDVFLLRFPEWCNDIHANLLVIRMKPPSVDKWLVAVPERIYAKEVPFFSTHRRYLNGGFHVEKEWFTELVDAGYRDRVTQGNVLNSSDDNYFIVEEMVAKETLFYYARLLSGVTRDVKQADKAKDDILTSRSTTASMGPLTTSFELYIIMLPLVITALVYLEQSRMKVLEKMAQYVQEPWILKDATHVLERMISIVWCFWPSVSIIVAYAMFAYGFGQGIYIGKWVIDPWRVGHIRVLYLLREPLLSLSLWMNWINWYANVLLICFFASLWISWMSLRSGLRIMSLYRCIKADPIL